MSTAKDSIPGNMAKRLLSGLYSTPIETGFGLNNKSPKICLPHQSKSECLFYMKNIGVGD